MSDAGSHEKPSEPATPERRTIAEDSRQRWAPDHPDVKEAGDDGPHRRDATNDAPEAGDSDERSGMQQ